MIPLYFRVHYHESEAEDDFILLSAPESTSVAALHERFTELQSQILPTESEYPSREDMIEHIFDTLAGEFKCDWNFCEVLFGMNVGAAT